jgi:death-on-curing protein
MIRLTKEEILILHEQLIERYGGTHGVRDENLLDSALNAPFQGFGDYEYYPSVVQKAVRLCFGLVMNHPFHDGNKRIGAMALLTTLDLNHLTLKTNSAELSEIILRLAAGSINDETLLCWVQDRLE